ncbi:MAG: GNAT family N-acetyltransferase [Phycisphaerales bacterium]|nr:GNAT family N-acetyltransferase [Phycisphaerales bacterium]
MPIHDPRYPPYGDELMIRIYQPEDQERVAALYERGHLTGTVDPSDTGADIENIQEGYFGGDGGSCFWVAVHDEHGVIGTIGAQRESDHCAQIRRLRVARPHRNRGVGTRLIKTSIAFCQEAGYLKVVLDTPPGRAPAIVLFEHFGFQLDATKAGDSDKTLDFYLDLYREPEAG